MKRLGIDIGSTTVKVAVIDEEHNILFSEYKRHFANIKETLKELVEHASKELGNVEVAPTITGSGGLALAQVIGIPFEQEVVCVSEALTDYAPQTDVAIELGGEDAKIIYFTNGVEQRMNGVCAGGTGSFIDQMASLLQTDAAGLNELAKGHKVIYPIASRCGVFAKTDIQPLINEGAKKEDLAASIFQAVVNQTIAGLACGKPIRGHVAFLGGPLHFLSELRQRFIETLKLTEETTIIPENSHLFAAYGTAVSNTGEAELDFDTLLHKLENGVELRGDEEFRRHDSEAKAAAEEDWYAEYLDLVLAVKMVGSVEEAVAHINRYGSRHSDGIVSSNQADIDYFFANVDSSTLYSNASTRFTDGGEFGMGAEIGISTDKLHARGPMGADELTSYKYLVRGDGQIRS